MAYRSITIECIRGGSGNCDDAVCDCACHTAEDLPATVEGVKEWHDALYREQDAYDPHYAGCPHQWSGYDVEIIDTDC